MERVPDFVQQKWLRGTQELDAWVQQSMPMSMSQMISLRTCSLMTNIYYRTASKAKRSSLLGSKYYEYLSAQEEKIHRSYSNVLEGIRPAGQFRSPHPVNRVPAPVPNLQDEGGEG